MVERGWRPMLGFEFDTLDITARLRFEGAIRRRGRYREVLIYADVYEGVRDGELVMGFNCGYYRRGCWEWFRMTIPGRRYTVNSIARTIERYDVSVGNLVSWRIDGVY
jgi:hypothetical protein